MSRFPAQGALGVSLFMMGLGLRLTFEIEPTIWEYATDFLMGFGVGTLWWAR